MCIVYTHIYHILYSNSNNNNKSTKLFIVNIEQRLRWLGFLTQNQQQFNELDDTGETTIITSKTEITKIYVK